MVFVPPRTEALLQRLTTPGAPGRPTRTPATSATVNERTPPLLKGTLRSALPPTKKGLVPIAPAVGSAATVAHGDATRRPGSRMTEDPKPHRLGDEPVGHVQIAQGKLGVYATEEGLDRDGP